MRYGNRIATLAAAGLLAAGAALASPASAGGFISLSVGGPGYFVGPLVVDSIATYGAPYDVQPAYEGPYYRAPASYPGNAQYGDARRWYHGPAFEHARIDSYRRAHFRDEERAHQYQGWNDHRYHGDAR